MEFLVEYRMGLCEAVPAVGVEFVFTGLAFLVYSFALQQAVVFKIEGKYIVFQDDVVEVGPVVITAEKSVDDHDVVGKAYFEGHFGLALKQAQQEEWNGQPRLEGQMSAGSRAVDSRKQRSEGRNVEGQAVINNQAGVPFL